MKLGKLIEELKALEAIIGAECEVVLYNSHELEEYPIEQVYEAGLEDTGPIAAISFNDR